MDVYNFVLLDRDGNLVGQARTVGLVAVPSRARVLSWLADRTVDSVN
jgi:hypothetical protein